MKKKNRERKNFNSIDESHVEKRLFNFSTSCILISHRFRVEIIRIRITHRTRIPKRPALKISCENKASSNAAAEDERNCGGRRNIDRKEHRIRFRTNATRYNFPATLPSVTRHNREFKNQRRDCSDDATKFAYLIAKNKSFARPSRACFISVHFFPVLGKYAT